MFVETLVGALAANALTVAFIYGIWRINRNERDAAGYAYAIGSSVVIGLSGLALLGA